MGERSEALVRLPIAIIAYIITEILDALFIIAAIFHWVAVIITGRRMRSLASFSNKVATYEYRFIRYAGFATNERVFPFNDWPKDIEKPDLKIKK